MVKVMGVLPWINSLHWDIVICGHQFMKIWTFIGKIHRVQQQADNAKDNFAVALLYLRFSSKSTILSDLKLVNFASCSGTCSYHSWLATSISYVHLIIKCA